MGVCLCVKVLVTRPAISVLSFLAARVKVRSNQMIFVLGLCKGGTEQVHPRQGCGLGAVPEKTSQSEEQVEYRRLGGGHPSVGGASSGGPVACRPGPGPPALQLLLGTLKCALGLSKMRKDKDR